MIPSSTSRRQISVPVQRAVTKRKKKAKETETAITPLEEVIDISPEIVSAVEKKRLQNTLSARKSRLRKQGEMESLKEENERLKARVEELKKMLGLE